MKAAFAIILTPILFKPINFILVFIFISVQQQAVGTTIDFEDNFNWADTLNALTWNQEMKIPLDPDYQFCTFQKDDKTLHVSDGILRIKPALLNDVYGKDFLYSGKLHLNDCTSLIKNECEEQARAYQILPPVLSAKINTKTNVEFQYGVIEIRAKFPEGDWLYPEMLLEPAAGNSRSPQGQLRVILGRARGNACLKRTNELHDDIGGGLLEFGIGTGSSLDYSEELVTKRLSEGSLWTKGFHVYKTVWNATGFTFVVDGEEVGKIRRENVAPFDQKFYLSIGLGVGGITVFPDETRSDFYSKPWKNTSAKARLLFWKAKDQWLPSWQRNIGNVPALEIDYVKVNAAPDSSTTSNSSECNKFCRSDCWKQCMNVFRHYCDNYTTDYCQNYYCSSYCLKNFSNFCRNVNSDTCCQDYCYGYYKDYCQSYRPEHCQNHTMNYCNVYCGNRIPNNCLKHCINFI